jgi:energy-coupling factor transporter ATP-binding protein EcfA2
MIAFWYASSLFWRGGGSGRYRAVNPARLQVLNAFRITSTGLRAALERQREEGGRLGDNITALGLMTSEQVAAAIEVTPASPRSARDTGITQGQCLNMMLKFMHLEGRETVGDLSAALKLPNQVATELMQEAINRKYVQSMGTIAVGLAPMIRYTLSDEGRKAVSAALHQTQYLGPIPVPLAAYQQQVRKQSVRNGFLQAERLRSGLEGLEVSEHYVRKLLPAINAGRTVLLYGPPGNGKTTVTNRIAALLEKIIYIPYAVEIAGQIIKLFDPGVHKAVVLDTEMQALASYAGLQIEAFDDRWVPCRRPFVTVAGELTLDMLDLQYNQEAKFYDAPAHVKALNGIFIIDDFGRQRLEPRELLNRWISPMENQVDYMKLHTGQIFSLPFDQLLIFSTNLEPQDLMDAAFLRRIPYKIRISAPEKPEYHRIFLATAKSYGLTLPDAVFEFIVETLTVRGRFELASFQPRFICDQVAEVCRSFGIERIVTRELAFEALANLYVQIESGGMEVGGALDTRK